MSAGRTLILLVLSCRGSFGFAYFQQISNNVTNHTYEPAGVNLPIDDEDEFKARMAMWKDFETIIKTLFRVNVALAVIITFGCLVLFLVIFNQNVRRKSPLWYWLHITALSIFCGFLIHVPGYATKLSDNKPFCRYIMFSPEYVFTLTAFLLILMNVEVLFSDLLQTKLWQNGQLSRFVVTVLLAWVITTFIVAHVTIENNTADKDMKYCFVLDRDAVKPRLALRDWFPCVSCFLLSAAILVAFYLQKSRLGFITSVGDLREITMNPGKNGDRLQLMLMVLFMNAIFILRVILYVVVRFQPRSRIYREPSYYIKFSVMMFIHSQTLYLLPYPALFVPEVRSALRHIGSRLLSVICGVMKGGMSEESTTIPDVRFANMKE